MTILSGWSIQVWIRERNFKGKKVCCRNLDGLGCINSGYRVLSYTNYKHSGQEYNLTWLNLTHPDLTWLDLTQLDLTQLDLTQLDLTWLNFFPQDSRKRRKPSFWPCVEVTPQNGKPLLSLKDFMAEDIIILILLYIHDYIFLPHHMHYANAFWMQGILLLYALNPKYLNWEWAFFRNFYLFSL